MSTPSTVIAPVKQSKGLLLCNNMSGVGERKNNSSRRKFVGTEAGRQHAASHFIKQQLLLGILAPLCTFNT